MKGKLKIILPTVMHDVRDDIATFERANRPFPPRPRSCVCRGIDAYWPHLDIFRQIFYSSEDVERSRREYQAEQEYRYKSRKVVIYRI